MYRDSNWEWKRWRLRNYRVGEQCPFEVTVDNNVGSWIINIPDLFQIHQVTLSNLSLSQTSFMETRKRSHSVEDDKIILKKHIVSDENGSPRVNGVSEGQNEEIDPAADDGLEVKFLLPFWPLWLTCFPSSFERKPFIDGCCIIHVRMRDPRGASRNWRRGKIPVRPAWLLCQLVGCRCAEFFWIQSKIWLLLACRCNPSPGT